MPTVLDRLPIQKRDKLPTKLVTWLDQERANKKTVAIVGFAPTTRDIAPYDNPNVEIWGLNEAYEHGFMVTKDGQFRADLWFQIHKPWSYQRPDNRNDPNHWHWLRNEEGYCFVCKGGERKEFHIKDKATGEIKTGPCPSCGGTGVYKPKNRLDFPIYMQTVDPEVPGAVQYPLEEIVADFCHNTMKATGDKVAVIEYFTSSFAYQAALVLWLNKYKNAGIKRVEVYGYEMSTDTEYKYQKGSTEWWLGKLDGHGVEVYLPDYSQLLHGAKYGFEVTQMINRQELEFRLRQLTQLENQRLASLNGISGRRQEREGIIKSLQTLLSNQPFWKMSERKSLTEEIQKNFSERSKLMQQEVNALNEANAIGGAKQEIEMLIKYIDAQYNFAEDKMEPIIPIPMIGMIETNEQGQVQREMFPKSVESANAPEGEEDVEETQTTEHNEA